MTVEKAIAALKAGELAVLPTETVYGIFADAKTETDKTIWMIAAELGQAPGL